MKDAATSIIECDIECDQKALFPGVSAKRLEKFHKLFLRNLVYKN